MKKDDKFSHQIDTRVLNFNTNKGVDLSLDI